MSKEMRLLECPLKGVNLIEANAGTGKTYTITALAARMIVELDFPVESVLIVTFTKAAVSDLKAKIYERLTGLRDGFKAVMAGEEPPEDDFIRSYVQSAEHPDTAVKRLDKAVRDFDTAAIFTIHSFCQRMLTENSFSGKIAYDTEMTGDPADILISPVRDFWRKYIYSLPKEAAEVFADETPETLTKFLMQIENNPSVKIENRPQTGTDDFLSLSGLLKQAAENARNLLDEKYVMASLFPDGKTQPLSKRSYTEQKTAGLLADIKKQIDDRDYTFYAKKEKKLHAELMTTEGMESRLNKNCELPQNPFFGAMDSWQSAWEDYVKCRRDLKNTIKLRLADYAQKYADVYRMRQNTQSYSDLITRMHAAVSADDSRMAEHIKNKFKAVMIDEFQDTDTLQYDIFINSFGRFGLPVFMIGDPKQAIYSFRGADVYTYLRASAGAADHTLTVNHRSDADLVSSVNGFFSRQDAFLIDKIGYNPSGGELSVRVESDGKRLGPMIVWQAENTDKEALAAACAYEISRLLNGRAEITDKSGTRRLRPSDFAVLTRNRKQAFAVRDRLAECLVPCVISGSENVFASAQAADMRALLAAAVSPNSEKAVRAALTGDIFGYTAEKIFSLTENDGWEDVFSCFTELSDILKRSGIAPMFFRAAKITGLYERLSAEPQGERRLTNMIHLSELLQKRETRQKGSPAQLLVWLAEQMDRSANRVEDYELKMDSDENAVTITTIHKSKGLEYNLVFTPFLMMSGDGGNKDEFPRFHNDDDELVMDMSAAKESRQKSDDERLAEDLRLIYVAMTRAKAVCWTAWGTCRRSSSAAMSYLVHGPNGKYDIDYLKAFMKDVPGSVLETLPAGSGQIYAADQGGISGRNRTFSKTVPEPWRINSFSGLIHNAAYSARDTDQFAAKAADEAEGFSIFSFPKGASAGSCLHECMEDTPLDRFTPETVLATAEEKLDRFFFDRQFAPAVAENMTNILTRELLPGVRLKGIKQDDHVHEMEFHIKTCGLRSDVFADILRAGGQEDFARACSLLDFSSAGGYLTGFSDLIFKSGEKFYVADWKSNYLGPKQEDYSQENMLGEMIRNHYYLQLYIYTAALHLHLKNRMPEYDYDRHMGGAVYVFMRGVGAEGDTGLYRHRPDKETVERIAEAMGE